MYNKLFKTVTTAITAAMMFSLCASSANASGTTNGAEDRPYYVRPANEVTGKVVAYTTWNETKQDIFKDVWEKYYPDCEIEYQTDSIGTSITKIRSDGSGNVDILIGGMFAADGDSYHDILQPYTAACNEEQLYHDESGYYTFDDVQVMCLVVNPELEQELGIEINGYEDLLQPELKGNVIIASPDAASSGYRQLQTVLAVMGDTFDDKKGWNYIEQLIPQTFSSTSSKDVFNLVANGEYVVGLSYESGVVEKIIDGAPIECRYMKEGNTAMASGSAIVKDAPNLSAAQAMIDLLSSAEFQQKFANESATRCSNGNCTLNGLPDESTLGLVDLDYNYLREHKDELIDKFTEMYAEFNS